MPSVTVQALRNVQLLPALSEGERRELPADVAKVLVAIKAVKIINKPSRTKSKEND